MAVKDTWSRPIARLVSGRISALKELAEENGLDASSVTAQTVVSNMLKTLNRAEVQTEIARRAHEIIEKGPRTRVARSAAR